MLLVVGLGNPGREYAGTRHNVGFAVVDVLRQSWRLPAFQARHGGLFTRGEVDGRAVALLEPQTFMNLSGDCVQPAAAFLKVAPGEIVVVHDELDLSWQDVRLKLGGGHAGHNGLRSILQRLGSPDFVRVRVGIGKPPPGDPRDVKAWVLSRFGEAEAAALPAVLERAGEAVRRVLVDGLAAAMNAVNTRV